MLIAVAAFFLGTLVAIYGLQGALLLSFAAVALLKQQRMKAVQGILFLFLGFIGAELSLQSYQNSILPKPLEGVDLQLVGRITEIPVQRHNGWRLYFEVDSSEPLTQLKNVQLNWYDTSAAPRLGQRWQFTARLKRPHGYANPGGFDYEQWMLSRGIHARGYIRNADRLVESSSYSLRQKLWDGLNKYELSSAKLAAALVLGEKQGLPREQRQLFIDSGTAHLFAISGLHIGMLASLLFLLAKALVLILLYLPPLPLVRLLQVLVLRFTPLRICLLFSLLGVIAYAGLAGWSLSTQRAVVMLIAVYIAWLLRCRITPLYGCALALLLILLLQPLAVLGMGFWLSFSAVLWIVYLLHVFLRGLANWKKVLGIQLLLPLCLWPLLQFGFFSAANLGALANLVLIPLVGTVVLPLSLLSVFVEGVSEGSAYWVLLLLEQVYQLILQGLEILNGQNWARPVSWKLNLSQLLLCQLGLLLLLLPRGLPLLFCAAGLLLLLGALVGGEEDIPEGEFQVSVLDVGQGLSVLLQTRSHSLLYDTGPEFASGFSLANAVVAPYLKHQGIGSLDMLMLSHGDSDHRGGLPQLLKSVAVDQLLSGQPERLNLTREVGLCRAGQKWQWDGVSFELLWPVPGNGTYSPRQEKLSLRANNNSCVLRVVGTQQSLLLTGDIEHWVEQQLLEEGESISANVMLAPHHGSQTSSGTDFIEGVDPDYVVFSAAYRSRFKHPSPKVVQRYADRGVGLFNTASCGRLLYDASGISCYRQQRAERWRSKIQN